ncbi:transcriptional regulator of acetoin/glycerol metabolism [Pseudoduganella flava]|uniref:GAF domain-containing protein n=1 Tax=Pseudoduganella flava TaxID=871742 RepID=A0A562PIY5_9BURK|nr:sigma-54-dependent Fis family transcriptional regulator [Pseudoduganella flava]QGZ41992.1 GAF domain-containing protein [Pseudoduganella flava]TWI44404.1 transcriptional regulator of acetoin/glycerol metabolism [Pseudoduganella flava]
MSDCAVDHGRRVRSIVQSRVGADTAGTSNQITRSWIRCLHDYQLDPGKRDEPEVVAAGELAERRARLAGVQAVAKVEMANLYQQLAGSGYAIVLTDAEGVLLDYFGDPGFTHAASHSGLMPGAVWSERAQGTNGMGTCLVERRPVTVHQDEHYLARHIGLSCAGAPIFDHEGEIVAALDASGESRLAQQHTLALVTMSVQMIENRVFLDRFRHDYILRFHNRPEFIGTLSEGALALDPTGKVLAATRCALFQLGLAKPAEVVGRDISELFNSSFPGLVDSTVKKAFHAVPIFGIRTGARFFGVMLPPVRAVMPHQPLRDAIAPTAAPLERLHFGDAAMARNVRTASRVLERNVAIMLLGETGTGKEVFAQALHQSGSRAGKPFVAINCAAIPETLIESELFGYRAGAFTGASKDGQHGKLYQANGGTLFLDEIGDMPYALQARLLRVLEERTIVPLGGGTPVPLDIHVTSATHCDLQQKIAEGTFREDLFYRLQGITLRLPPLRERSDLRALVAHIVAEESDEDAVITLDDTLLAALERQRWPGNLRQLRHLLRAMIALREADHLTVHDLPPEYRTGIVVPELEDDADDDVAPAAADTALNPLNPLNPLESAERDALLRELQRHSWNISTVARQLGMSRNTLYRKVERLHIRNPGKPLPC